VSSKTGIALMLMAAIVSYFFQTPFVFPFILLVAGLVTALKYKSCRA
jgi:chromate transporter